MCTPGLFFIDWLYIAFATVAAEMLLYFLKFPNNSGSTNFITDKKKPSIGRLSFRLPAKNDGR